MEYLFSPDNWEWLWTENNARFLLEAFLINIQIAVIAMVFALALGLLLALLSLSTMTPLRLVAKGWVDLFRNLPLIFLILYLALSLPESIKQGWEDNAPGFLPDVLRGQLVIAGILGLILYNSAVLGEIMRAGILSLDRGQREAATALGLSYRNQMRFVILPQGLRRMVPATVSQLITLNKDTTLVSIIAIQEVVRSGRVLSQTAGNPFVGGGDVQAPILQVMLFVGLLFVITNYALSRLSRRLEVRESRRTAGARPVTVTGVEDLALPTTQEPPRTA
jgi:His/Glu/Gln/Arg/opine family amino acid ABC transporter permease subunit